MRHRKLSELKFWFVILGFINKTDTEKKQVTQNFDLFYKITQLKLPLGKFCLKREKKRINMSNIKYFTQGII